MKNEITIEEQRAIMLEILDALIDFCEKNRIQYFLVGGSLIGAVRHHGFIPWDDDIDVAFLRQDYDMIVNNFNNSSTKQYKLISINNKKNYYLPYAKIIDTRTVLKENVWGICSIGVNIDLFPLDYITNETRSNFKRIINKKTLIEKMIEYKSIKLKKNRKLWKNIIIVLLRLLMPLPYSSCAKIKNARLKKYISINKTDWIASFFGAWGEKEITEAKNVENINKCFFEKREVNIPIGYDNWLKSIYGNYMQLPPKDKRVSHHDYCAFWK